ncbi:MAG: glycoside hydrolase family 10 protein [Armatimonadota bacterium]
MHPLLLLLPPAVFGADQHPLAEARAMWVVRTSLKSPQSVSRVVELAHRYGFSALVVQVRGRGDAYYLGGLEPKAEALDSQPPDFDPLAQIIREAHAAGISVHAWMNTFYCWSGSKPPRSPKHVVNAHPEWLLADRTGKPWLASGETVEGAYLNPALPEVRRFVHDVFLDVVRRYDIDGIHFDYVRYPAADLGYSNADLALFRDYAALTVPAEVLERVDALPDRLACVGAFPDLWAQWRRRNVTALVRAVYHSVKQVKPDVIVSAATIPWGFYRGFQNSDAYKRVGQDWFAWLKNGILDLACPMTYHEDTEQFAGWVEAAVQNSCNRPVWAGIGAYLLSPESTAEKVRTARQLGASGFCLFSYDAITQNGTSEDYLKALKQILDVQP